MFGAPSAAILCPMTLGRSLHAGDSCEAHRLLGPGMGNVSVRSDRLGLSKIKDRKDHTLDGPSVTVP